MVRRSLRAALVLVFTLSALVLGFAILSALQLAIGPRAHEFWMLISGFEIVAFLVSAIGLWFVAFGGERAVSVAAIVHAVSLFVLVGTMWGPQMVLPLVVGLFEVIASYLLIEHAQIEHDVLG